MRINWATVATVLIPLAVRAAPASTDATTTPAVGTLGGLCAGFGGFKCLNKAHCCYMNQRDALVADAAGVCMYCENPYRCKA
ncbi:hypothetical protein BDV93DRAFT_526083 [Ceratobasidium sp. AG-I]|nr:hypothetical protein BDV93DRAFT_526083 [Ceratobasidium sp. AG-I]